MSVVEGSHGLIGLQFLPGAEKEFGAETESAAVGKEAGAETENSVKSP